MIIENQTVVYNEPKQSHEQNMIMKLRYLQREGNKMVKPSTKPDNGRFPAWATKK